VFALKCFREFEANFCRICGVPLVRNRRTDQRIILQALLLVSLVTVLATAYEATVEQLAFGDTVHVVASLFYIAIAAMLGAGAAFFQVKSLPMLGGCGEAR
jgi:hypothetical protein